MCISETACEYDGEIYNIVSDLLGASSEEAEKLQAQYEAKGCKVRINEDDTYPGIPPKGPFFVYAKK